MWINIYVSFRVSYTHLDISIQKYFEITVIGTFIFACILFKIFLNILSNLVSQHSAV